MYKLEAIDIDIESHKSRVERATGASMSTVASMSYKRFYLASN